MSKGRRYGRRCHRESRVQDYSALLLAARITLAHFSVSSAMSLPTSAGESAHSPPPSFARCVLILGPARPPLLPLVSLSTISVGAFFGAPLPSQRLSAQP